MRSQIYCDGDVCLKKVRTEKYVFECMLDNLDYLESTMNKCGLFLPETIIAYMDGELIFEQHWIHGRFCQDYNELCRIFMGFDYSRFGLDSNPNNFILGLDNKIYMIDLFPFLMRDREILRVQFAYSVNEALLRYFQLVNVISTYIARLFLRSYDLAISALSLNRAFLKDNFKDILPREKLRLLAGMELKSVPRFHKVYLESKIDTQISNGDSIRLLHCMENL